MKIYIIDSNKLDSITLRILFTCCLYLYLFVLSCVYSCCFAIFYILFMYKHSRMHCRWYRVKVGSLLQLFFLIYFLDTSISLSLIWSSVRVRPFVLYENRQKASCANKLWLVPQNVIVLDIWLFCQVKLVVRAFKNTQNLKIAKMWVSPLAHDAILMRVWCVIL